MGSLVLATLTPLLADYKWQVAAEILVQITPPCTICLAGSGLALASTIVLPDIQQPQGPAHETKMDMGAILSPNVWIGLLP